MDAILSNVTVAGLVLFIMVGYVVISKVPGAKAWLTPFAQNWYVLLTLVLMLSMSLSMNVIQSANTWGTYVLGIIVVLVIFGETFGLRSSARRQLVMIVVMIAFVVGASVISLDEQNKWIGYLVFLVLMVCTVSYFLAIGKFKENMNFKDVIQLVTSKRAFVYLVMAFTVMSLICQYTQFDSAKGISYFTIVLTVLFLGFIPYAATRQGEVFGSSLTSVVRTYV